MNTLTLDDAQKVIQRQAAEIIRLQETIAVMRDGEMCPYCQRRDAHCTCYAPVKDGEDFVLVSNRPVVKMVCMTAEAHAALLARAEADAPYAALGRAVCAMPPHTQLWHFSDGPWSYVEGEYHETPFAALGLPEPQKETE